MEEIKMYICNSMIIIMLIILLFNVANMAYLLIAVKKGQKIQKPEFTMRCAIAFFLWFAILYSAQENISKFHMISTIILIATVLCVTMQWKIMQNKTWRELLDKMFLSFYNGKKNANRIGQWIDIYRSKIYLILLVIVILFGTIGVARNNLDILTVLTCCVLFILMFLGMLRGMHSCRRLLMFWLALVAVAFVISYIIMPWGINILLSDMPIVLFIVLITFTLSLFWVLSIAYVDNDVGKMAILVINTCTTITLIIVNVCAAYGSSFAKTALDKEIWVQLQLVGLCVNLPFVIAGYTAALFKEAQIYWSKKHHEKIKR